MLERVNVTTASMGALFSLAIFRMRKSRFIACGNFGGFPKPPWTRSWCEIRFETACVKTSEFGGAESGGIFDN